VDDRPVMGVTGDPAFTQSTLGVKGNFELLVPQGNRLAYYFRDNDAPGFPWRRGGDLPRSTSARGAIKFSPAAVSLIQTNFNEPGNLEAIVRMAPVFDTGSGDTLAFYFRDSRNGRWFGPDFFKVNGEPITGVTGF